MELPSLLTKVLAKTAPVSSMEQEKISNGCRLWYDKLIDKTKTKQREEQPLTFIDKMVLQLDQWYVQVIFAMAYFFIIRFIQDLMNPGDDHQDDSPQ